MTLFFSPSEVLASGWLIFKKNSTVLVIAVLVLFIIIIGQEIVLQPLRHNNHALPLLYLFELIFYVINAYLHIGIIGIYLNAIDSKPTRVTALFSGGRYLLRYIVGSIIHGFLIFIPIGIALIIAMVITLSSFAFGHTSAQSIVPTPLPFVTTSPTTTYTDSPLLCSSGQTLCASAIENSPSQLLLGIVPGIVAFFVGLAMAFYLAMRFSFYTYFIVDQDMGPTDALRASWHSTGGQVFRLLVFDFLGLFVILLGLLALLVGILVATPVVGLATTLIYRHLSAKPDSSTPVDPTRETPILPAPA